MFKFQSSHTIADQQPVDLAQPVSGTPKDEILTEVADWSVHRRVSAQKYHNGSVMNCSPLIQPWTADPNLVSHRNLIAKSGTPLSDIGAPRQPNHGPVYIYPDHSFPVVNPNTLDRRYQNHMQGRHASTVVWPHNNDGDDKSFQPRSELSFGGYY